MNRTKLTAGVLLFGGLVAVVAFRAFAPDAEPEMTGVADAGTAMADAGTAMADAGTAMADAGTAMADAGTAMADAGTAIHVYKTATCGCCGLWVEHLRAAGFEVTVEDLPNPELAALKQRHGIAPELSSCHTALAGGYVFEGHIPADVIESFLEEAPGVKGISVPGMPIGSPGMEGSNPRPYAVIAFDGKGNRTVYRQIDPR